MNDESTLEELAMVVPLEVGSDNEYVKPIEKETERAQIEIERNEEKYSDIRLLKVFISIATGTALGVASKYIPFDLDTAAIITVGGYTVKRGLSYASLYERIEKLPLDGKIELAMSGIKDLTIDSACF